MTDVSKRNPETDKITGFNLERTANIARLNQDKAMRDLSARWLQHSLQHKYSYNFDFLGRPIIQYPQDMVAIQELVWNIQPDLIIETGIAHGGSLIQSASMLALLDYCDAVEAGATLDPAKTRRRVLGIDIDIRDHNREAIEKHPMSHRIDMIQGSSVSAEIVTKVHRIAKTFQRVLVILDSNHTHEHVLAELEAYAPLTSKGSYCVVLDTIIEDLPESSFPDRPWGRGDSPKSAVKEYLSRLDSGTRSEPDGGSPRFEIDDAIEAKLQISVAPGGYLRRTG